MRAARSTTSGAPLALAAVALFASGCASIGQDANRQGAFIRTEPPGAEIWVDGLPVARSPAHVEIERSRKPAVQIKSVDGLREHRLPRRYRWGRSFFGNFVYLLYAPVGWAIDLAAGTAWQAEDPPPIAVRLSAADLRDAKARDERSAQKPVVAIAPPFSDFPDLSDLAGEELERSVRAAHPEYRILPYRSTLSTFIAGGYDVDGPPDDQRLIWAKLGARYVFESSIEGKDGELVLSARRRDPTTGESSAPIEARFQAGDEWAEGYSSRQWWARLAPNSLGLVFASQNLKVTAGGREYTLNNRSPSQLWEQGLQYLSALELTNVPHRRAGRAIRPVFGFVPALRLSKFSVSATDLPGFDGSTEQVYHRLRVGGGYGGEAGVQLGRHYLYANLIPILYWSQISWEPPTGQERSITTTGLQAQVELGYAAFVTSKWHLRLFVRTQSEDAQSWQEALGDRLPQSQRNGFGVQETSTGLALAYRFEPEFQRRRGGSGPAAPARQD